jgi:hypothetical protein
MTTSTRAMRARVADSDRTVTSDSDRTVTVTATADSDAARDQRRSSPAQNPSRLLLAPCPASGGRRPGRFVGSRSVPASPRCTAVWCSSRVLPLAYSTKEIGTGEQACDDSHVWAITLGEPSREPFDGGFASLVRVVGECGTADATEHRAPSEPKTPSSGSRDRNVPPGQHGDRDPPMHGSDHPSRFRLLTTLPIR